MDWAAAALTAGQRGIRDPLADLKGLITALALILVGGHRAYS